MLQSELKALRYPGSSDPEHKNESGPQYALDPHQVEAAFQKFFLRKEIPRILHDVKPTDDQINKILETLEVPFNATALRDMSSPDQIRSAVNVIVRKLKKSLVAAFPVEAKPVIFYKEAIEEINKLTFTEQELNVGLYRDAGAGDYVGEMWHADAAPLSNELIQMANDYFSGATELVLEKGKIKISNTYIDENGIQMHGSIKEIDELFIGFVERLSAGLPQLKIPLTLQQEIKPLLSAIDTRVIELNKSPEDAKKVKRSVIKILFLRAVIPAMTKLHPEGSKEQALFKLSSNAITAFINGVSNYKGNDLPPAAGRKLGELAPKFMTSLDDMVEQIQKQ